MTARQRFFGLAVVHVLGVLAGVPLPAAGQGPSGGFPPYGMNSPEPPLASGVAPRLAPRANGSPFQGRYTPAGEPPVPVVALHLHVPARSAAGQDLEYRIQVENTSQGPAYHVTVLNPLPPHTRFVRASPEPSTAEPDLTWKLGTLAPGASREIVLVLSPTGTGDVHDCARVQFDHGQCVTTKLSRPELRLEKRGPATALLQDIVTYQLVVTNTGAAEATGVRVVDSLQDGLQLVDTQTEGQPARDGGHGRVWELGTLAAGQSKRLEYRVRVRALGTHRNEAAVEAAGISAQKASHEITVTEPKLSLDMRGPVSGPNYTSVPTTYQLTVTNPGSAPATNVVVKDRLPPQTLVDSTSSGGRSAAGTVQWQVGTLPAGGQRTLQLVVRAQAAGEARHQATVSADRGLAAEAEAKTTYETFNEPVGVHLSVRNEEGNLVEVNATTRFTISVVNQGRTPITKVRLVATVPAEMQMVDTQPRASAQAGKVTFEPFDVQPGGSTRYEVKVKALRAGEVHLQVDMSADQLPKPVHNDRSTTVFQSESTPPPPAAPLPGAPLPAPSGAPGLHLPPGQPGRP